MSELHDRIVKLAKNRIPPHTIAKMLCIRPDKVISSILAARSNGEDIPNFSTGKRLNAATAEQLDRQLTVPVRLHGLLQAHADQRGLTPSEAAGRILETALLNNWSQSDA